MYLLYLLGLMLEPAIGSVRFALIYATALLTGSFGVVFATAGASLGASGAIFGLMGAAVVELRARRIGVMQSGIGGLIILNLILSFTLANISIGAHIGGLIGGFLAGLAIRAADAAPAGADAEASPPDAIVSAIADAHGASVTARAREGGGLDVTVSFRSEER